MHEHRVPRQEHRNHPGFNPGNHSRRGHEKRGEWAAQKREAPRVLSPETFFERPPHLRCDFPTATIDAALVQRAHEENLRMRSRDPGTSKPFVIVPSSQALLPEPLKTYSFLFSTETRTSYISNSRNVHEGSFHIEPVLAVLGYMSRIQAALGISGAVWPRESATLRVCSARSARAGRAWLRLQWVHACAHAGRVWQSGQARRERSCTSHVQPPETVVWADARGCACNGCTRARALDARAYAETRGIDE